MDDKEEFPFEDLIEALSDVGDVKKALKKIIAEIKDKNIYWIYSVFSTLIQVIKSKNEQPQVKCRCLQASFIILQTCQYPVITIFEVYLLPVLQEIVLYRVKKTQKQIAYYFQQVFGIQDSEKLKKHSVQYVERATELIQLCYKIKPYRTVQHQQLKQASLFSEAKSLLTSKGIQNKMYKWNPEDSQKLFRKQFLLKLKRFSEQSQAWSEFLLVNLIQEIKTSKKELLQLRLLLAYGQTYITSAMINICEDQLVDLSEEFEHKRKFLGVINQLIRLGDIEAIIMVKNSEFLPAICSQISKIAGHLGLNQGEKIFPQISASKKDKKQFYSDFMRCLQNWAICMPSDYDNDDFNLKAIYKYLKQQKKFKFPDNLHLSRYQKQLKENMLKNKERNSKIIQILQNLNESKQVSISMKKSLLNQNHKQIANLSVKIKQIQKQLKKLQSGEEHVQPSMKILLAFKDNWINFLQDIDVQKLDENQLQTLINQGQKYVEKIQLIVPIEMSYKKGKFNYQEFKVKVAECTQFYQEVSQHNISQNNCSKTNLKQEISNIKSLINSNKIKLSPSQFGTSSIRNRNLRQRMKSRNSKLSGISKMDHSKALDRSHLSRSIDRSRMQKSRLNTDINKNLYVAQFQDVVKETQRKGSINHNQGSNLTIKQTNSIKKQSSLHIKKENNNSKNEALLSDIIHAQKMGIEPPQHVENHDLSRRSSEKGSEKRLSYHRKSGNSKISIESKGQIKQYKESIVKRISDYDPQEKSNHDQSQKSQVSKLNSLNSSSSSKKKLQQVNKSRESQRSSKRFQKFSQNKKIQKDTNPILIEYEQQLRKVEIIESQNKVNHKQNSNLRRSSQKQSDVFKKKQQSKKVYKQKQADNFDDYNSISSIHSVSQNKIFQNSVQQVLNITKKQSQLNIKAKNNVSTVNQDYKINQKGKQYHEESYQYKKESSSQDIIQNPDVDPRKNSFHSKLSNLDSFKKTEKVPLFKDAFRNNDNNSVYYREKEEKLLRKNSGIKNIIKSAKSLSQNKKQSIVNKLFAFQENGSSQNQRSNHQKIGQYNQNYYADHKDFRNIQYESLVQSQKDKEINHLRQKIKQLQKQSLTMRTKLAVKDNEIQSMKNLSVSGSERGFQFTSTNQSHFAKNSNRSEKSSLRGSSVSKVVSMTQFQKEIQSNFKQYLQKIKGSTFKKSLLKVKCLIHKTDEVQMGCLSQRGQRILQSTVFITPQLYDLVDITFTMQHDSNLKIKLHTTSIKKVEAKKQHKINLTVEIKNIPFSLPELEVTYKSSAQYSSTYARITLPLGFNKFCEVFSINLEEVSTRHILFIRTDDFKMNTKVSKLQKIHEFFANFTTIPPKKQRNYYLILGKCKFGKSIFNICLSLSQKNSWIQGFLLQGEPTQMNFLICTLKQILDVKTK